MRPAGTVDWPLETLVHEGSSRGHPVLDADRCNSCGECAVACPSACIEVVAGEPPVVDAGNCVRCGLCVEACSQDAVTLEGARDIATFDRRDLVLAPGSLPQPRAVGRAPLRLYRLAISIERAREVTAEELLERRWKPAKGD